MELLGHVGVFACWTGMGSGGMAKRVRLVEQPSEAATLYRLTDRLFRARDANDAYDAALDAILEGLECERASILLFDPGGVMRFVASRGLSETYQRALEGHTPWRPGEREPQPVIVPDIGDTAEPRWVKDAVRQEGIRALAFIPLVSDGETIGKFMTYYDAPRNFSSHDIDFAVNISRQLGFSIERTRSEKARRIAEQDLRESEERFRLMSEQAPVMIWLSDATGKCLHLNKPLRDFWGVAESDIPTFNWTSTIHPNDVERIGAAMADSVTRRTGVEVTGRFRNADGQYRTLQTNARPRLSSGEFLGMIGVNIDITEREAAESARRDAETQRELLIAELNHRVKNTLAVVQAIAHQTFRNTAEAARHAFDGRLMALAHAHDLLTHVNWGTVSLDDLIIGTLRIPLEEGRVVLAGPPVMLQPRQAVSLGLALHEMFTNAMKYGALSNANGRVYVTWAPVPSENTRLLLTWREEGGPPVKAPDRKGFGSLLLERTLKGDLNADVKVSYPVTGLVCEIDLQRSWGSSAKAS